MDFDQIINHIAIWQVPEHITCKTQRWEIILLQDYSDEIKSIIPRQGEITSTHLESISDESDLFRVMTLLSIVHHESAVIEFVEPRIENNEATFFEALTFGAIRYRFDLFELAQRIFRYAIQKNPDSFFAWLGLGQSDWALEEFDPALRDLRKAIECDPKNPFGFSQLALVYLENMEYKQAMSFYRLATQMDQLYHPAWYGLGQVYRGIGEQKLASQHFTRAEYLARQQNDIVDAERYAEWARWTMRELL